ncbi:hypothetical protein DPMN_140980 [Dreissena polymorpha]|uniref:Uncharacterized protein n=1 Tax=Dreissena polymorpha TaxID=45954 RepID=A0A9D4G8L8_DREPO|nr:hypothetical protein DPMN_140980 [Dreissena polymorpha]
MNTKFGVEFYKKATSVLIRHAPRGNVVISIISGKRRSSSSITTNNINNINNAMPFVHIFKQLHTN